MPRTIEVKGGVPVVAWPRKIPADALVQLMKLARQPYVVSHVAAMPDLEHARVIEGVQRLYFEQPNSSNLATLLPRSTHPGYNSSSASHTSTSPSHKPASVAYQGSTSQHKHISFTVSGGKVRNLRYSILDACPNHRRVVDQDSGFSPMRIQNGSFGGTFVDPGKARAVVKGKINGGSASGSLSDSAHFHGAICKGHATFSAHASQ